MIVEGVKFVEGWGSGVSTAERFVVMKSPELMETYVEVLGDHQGGNMVELGIREGGSTALMALAGKPSKLVAVELAPDAPALTALIDERGLPVRPYFGLDQGDRERLREILDTEFDGPLDLVIDDASHRYELTRASFEVIFPRLRPGGLFIIEDWRWQYRLSSGLIRRLGVAKEGGGWLTEAMVEQEMLEASLIDAVMTDPSSDAAQQVLEAEAAGQLTAPQQARLAEARRDGQTSPPEEPTTAESERPLATMAAQLMLSQACGTGVVARVAVDDCWLTVERGAEVLDDDWRLTDAYDDHYGMLT